LSGSGGARRAAEGRAATGPALRSSAFYAAYFAALGVHLPFWPLWLSDWGLSEGEIGAYAAAGFGARIVAGMVLPVAADRLAARRWVLAASAGTAAVAFLAHLLVETKLALLLLTLASAGALSAMLPIGDALGVAASRAFGFAYARSRAAGSAAFLAANLALGSAMAVFGADAALWVIVVALSAAAWLGLTHPGGGLVQPGPRPGLTALGRLARAPAFLLFALSAGFAQASHGPLYAYGSIHWRDLGLTEGTIGALWAWGVAVEILLMTLVGAWMTRRLGPSGMLALAGGAGVVRWALMTTEPTGPLLWALQGSHALTFAAAHLGAMAFLGAAAPARMAGAGQAAFQVAVGGGLMAGSTALSAFVYPLAGGGAWWIGCAFSAGALAAALAARRIWDGGELPVEDGAADASKGDGP